MPKSVRGVMNEYARGVLHSGSSHGPVVTKPKQAIAIALSEQRQMKKAASHPHRNLGKYLHKPKGR